MARLRRIPLLGRIIPSGRPRPLSRVPAENPRGKGRPDPPTELPPPNRLSGLLVAFHLVLFLSSTIALALGASVWGRESPSRRTARLSRPEQGSRADDFVEPFNEAIQLFG